jgi:uncharacterized protein (DUF952 family)
VHQLAPREVVICHIVKRSEWMLAVARGTYAPVSLPAEGYIHCSTLAQVIDTANRFYRGKDDLVLLHIDESRLKADLRYEAPRTHHGESGGELFPHLYGELNVDAVVRVIEFPCEVDGSFAGVTSFGFAQDRLCTANKRKT